MIADITVYLYNLTYDPRLEDGNSALFIRHAHAFCKDVSFHECRLNSVVSQLLSVTFNISYGIV